MISQKNDLEKKLSWYQIVAEMGNEGILVFDEIYKIEFANSMASELTGYTNNELLGMKFISLLNDDGRKFLNEMKLKVKEKQQFKVCAELKLLTAENEQKDVEICIAGNLQEGKVKTVAYLRDISTRIKMQNELKRTNQFFKNLLENSVNGIVVADMKGKIMIFNAVAERILGYHADEMLEQHVTKLYPRQDAREIMRKLRSQGFGGKGKLNPTIYSVLSKDGELIPIQLAAFIVYDELGAEMATVGVFTDLRERIKIEKQLQKTQLQLIQSEKMASLGKLAAGIAHEINNPLGGILIYSSMLREETKDDDPKREDLDKIIEATTRCKRIVKDLLEFAHQSKDQFESININRNIEQCLSLLQNQALFHNIKITKSLNPELPKIQGNPGQLNQVFTNLIVNAAEAMPHGGTICIKTDFSSRNDFIKIEITDEGIGIPKKYLSQIFDPFFTTKEVGKGTGLGLSISYGIIVDGHKGEIYAKSKEGKGTTFIIELPLKL